MNQALASGWSLTGQFGAIHLTAGDLALLAVMGALLALLCIYRAKYVGLWSAGWAALLASRFIAHGSLPGFSLSLIHI